MWMRSSWRRFTYEDFRVSRTIAVKTNKTFTEVTIESLAMQRFYT